MAQAEVWGRLVTSESSEERTQVVSGGALGQDKMGECGWQVGEGWWQLETGQFWAPSRRLIG